VRLLVLLLLAGCAGEIEDPSIFDAEVCDMDVQEDILVPRCARAGCHVPTQPMGGIEYATAGLEQRLVGVESQTCGGSYRIDPQDPEASHLLVRLSPEPRCGEEELDRMPMIGEPLTEHELECVRQWVIELAGGPAE
jgi:hypothetical protein